MLKYILYISIGLLVLAIMSVFAGLFMIIWTEGFLGLQISLTGFIAAILFGFSAGIIYSITN